MLKLLLIRHGESTGNQAQRMAGLSNDGLTAKGLHQCYQLGKVLRQRDWHPSHIYSSPLRRAVASVAAFVDPWQWELPNPLAASAQPEEGDFALLSASADALPPPILHISKHLQEFDAGVLTGLTWREAKERYPDLCRALETSSDWVPIPQAETPISGRNRAQAFIQQLLATHHNQDAIWVVSHHWIMEHLVACLLGCDRTWQLQIANTALFEFWLDRDRWSDNGIHRGISDLWQIKRFGDCQHLNAHQ